MKNCKTILLCSVFYFACNDIKEEKSMGKSFELLNGDTINVTYGNGNKQGAWYTYKKSTKGIIYTDSSFYENGRKIESRFLQNP